MPELPEVEVLKESLKPFVENKRILKVKVYYEKAFLGSELKAIEDKEIESISRRGKYLIFSLFPKGALVCHLRMTGKLIYKENAKKLRHDHLSFELSEGYLYYNDVRKFGGFHYYETVEAAFLALNHLGLEPFDEAFTGAYLYQKTRGRKKPIKNLLLDQNIVAGLGNIYADEVLFASKIRPKKGAYRLTKKACDTLVIEIRRILKEAIFLGGSSIKDYSNALGELGQFQKAHKVYGRGKKPCKDCGESLKKITLLGRSTVYCPRCQK